MISPRDLLIKAIDAYLAWTRRNDVPPNPAERRISERRANSDRRAAAQKAMADKAGTAGGQSGEGDDAEQQTRLMSARDMVDTLVNGILTNAGMPAEMRRVKLYNLSEDSSVDGQFVLMVNFKGAIPGVWEHLPALGQHIAKQINTRLDIKVSNVYWSLARSAEPLSKMPPAWLTNRVAPVAVGGVASAIRRA